MNNINTESPQQFSLESFLKLALQGVHFGSIEITVHDARIVQIERRETFRPQDARFRSTRSGIK